MHTVRKLSNNVHVNVRDVFMSNTLSHFGWLAMTEDIGVKLHGIIVS